MSLSILPYIGSKRTDIKFYEKYMPNPSHIDVSVELFGGSGYNSLYLFSLNNKIKSIINDVDDDLINFFNQIKQHPDEIVEQFNKLVEPKPTKDEFDNIKLELKKENLSNLRKAVLYLFFKKFHGLRELLYPTTKSIGKINKDKYETFFNWLKNTEFILNDYQEVYKNIIENKKKKRYFLFLDPPYLCSFNSEYKTYKKDNLILIDNTQLYINIIDYLKKKKF